MIFCFMIMLLVFFNTSSAQVPVGPIMIRSTERIYYGPMVRNIVIPTSTVKKINFGILKVMLRSCYYSQKVFYNGQETGSVGIFFYDKKSK